VNYFYNPLTYATLTNPHKIGTEIDVNETIEEITMEELCKRLGKQVKIIKS
jgi:hypothetical protein